MSEDYIYKSNVFEYSIIDVIGLMLSTIFIIVWTYILCFYSVWNFHNVFQIIFYSGLIYGSLFFIFIYSLLNIIRSSEIMYISIKGFKLPKRKLIEFIKKTNNYVEFKDVSGYRYVWYGLGCNIILKNNKEIFISPDNCGIDGYLKICQLLEEKNPSHLRPNMDLVKKWFELKKEGWKKRKEEKEFFKILMKENSAFK